MKFLLKIPGVLIISALLYSPALVSAQEKTRVMRVCIGPCDPVKKKKPKPKQQSTLTPEGKISEQRNAALRAENARKRAARERDAAIVKKANAKRQKEIDRCWMAKFGQSRSAWNGSVLPEAVDCRGFVTGESPFKLQQRLAEKRKALDDRNQSQIEMQTAEYRRQLAIKEDREKLRSLNLEQVKRTEQEARYIAGIKAQNAKAKRQYTAAQENHRRQKQAYDRKVQAYKDAQARYEAQMRAYREN